MAEEKKPADQSKPPSGPTQPQGSPAVPESHPNAPKAGASGTPEKTAAHGEAPKPAGVMAATPWESEMGSRLKQRHGSGIQQAATYLKQNFFVVDNSIVHDVLRLLRDDEQFDYLVDVTAVHYPEREKPFEVVWILYSFARNERVRVKTAVAENEDAPSVVALWSTANWLEREAYDMFGVKFAGHPDMRRILLPEDWKGFPLRKDYGIIQQDQEWVQIHLGIESGQ